MDAAQLPVARRSTRHSQPAAPAAPALPLPAAEQLWRVGDRVQGHFEAQFHGPAKCKWYLGTVRVAHEDGTCDIDYDDGDFEERVPPAHIKSPATTKSPAAAAEPAAAATLAEARPCTPVMPEAVATPAEARPCTPVMPEAEEAAMMEPAKVVDDKPKEEPPAWPEGAWEETKKVEIEDVDSSRPVQFSPCKDGRSLALNQPVQLHGLVAKPELNGRHGRALHFDEEKGRVIVDMSSATSLSLRPENLTASSLLGETVEVCGLTSLPAYNGVKASVVQDYDPLSGRVTVLVGAKRKHMALKPSNIRVVNSTPAAVQVRPANVVKPEPVDATRTLPTDAGEVFEVAPPPRPPVETIDLTEDEPAAAAGGGKRAAASAGTPHQRKRRRAADGSVEEDVEEDDDAPLSSRVHALLQPLAAGPSHPAPPPKPPPNVLRAQLEQARVQQQQQRQQAHVQQQREQQQREQQQRQQHELRELSRTLPFPWRAERSRSTGRLYYLNRESGETTWSRPRHVGVVDSSGALRVEAPPPPPRASPPLDDASDKAAAVEPPWSAARAAGYAATVEPLPGFEALADEAAHGEAPCRFFGSEAGCFKAQKGQRCGARHDAPNRVTRCRMGDNCHKMAACGKRHRAWTSWQHAEAYYRREGPFATATPAEAVVPASDTCATCPVCRKLFADGKVTSSATSMKDHLMSKQDKKHTAWRTKQDAKHTAWRTSGPPPLKPPPYHAHCEAVAQSEEMYNRLLGNQTVDDDEAELDNLTDHDERQFARMAALLQRLGKGAKLAFRMGHAPGRGLGKRCDGIVKPLPHRPRRDHGERAQFHPRLGLGATPPARGEAPRKEGCAARGGLADMFRADSEQASSGATDEADEVEYTGTRTREDRDAELRQQAVNVEC